MLMNLSVYSPEKTFFSGQVKSAHLPGTAGNFQVLYGHAPLVSTLEPGKLVYKTAQDEKNTIPIQGGIAKVDANNIKVYVI